MAHTQFLDVNITELVENAPFKRPRTITKAPQEPVDSDNDFYSNNIIFHQNSTMLIEDAVLKKCDASV